MHSNKIIFSFCVSNVFLFTFLFGVQESTLTRSFFAFVSHYDDHAIIRINGLYESQKTPDGDCVKWYLTDVGNWCVAESTDKSPFLSCLLRDIILINEHPEFFIESCVVESSADQTCWIYRFEKNVLVQGRDMIFVFKIMVQLYPYKANDSKKYRDIRANDDAFLSTSQIYDYIFDSCCNPVEIKGIIEYKRNVGAAHGKNK